MRLYVLAILAGQLASHESLQLLQIRACLVRCRHTQEYVMIGRQQSSKIQLPA
jgi:hypothetical protein